MAATTYGLHPRPLSLAGSFAPDAVRFARQITQLKLADEKVVKLVVDAKKHLDLSARRVGQSSSKGLRAGTIETAYLPGWIGFDQRCRGPLA